MSPTKQTLHHLIDIVDNNEIGILYQLLLKFVPDDVAMADEVEAMNIAEKQFTNGEIVGHNSIDWN